MLNKQSYYEGYQAFSHGHLLIDNPYGMDYDNGVKYRSWLTGWRVAEMEKEC